MSKYIILFCLIWAQAWGMETSWKQDANPQGPCTRSSTITINEALVKLTFLYKLDLSNDDGYKTVRNVDLTIPLQDISNEIPWCAENMSLVDTLTISIPNPLANENIIGGNLNILIRWPEKDVIKLFWQWGYLKGSQEFLGIFPGNQKTTNVYTLLAEVLFGSRLRCPAIFAKICERLILTFDQPTSITPNMSFAKSP
jgi:hypothetical protein